MAKGDTKIFSMEYQKTFVIVAKMSTIRVLLSLVTKFNCYLGAIRCKEYQYGARDILNCLFEFQVKLRSKRASKLNKAL